MNTKVVIISGITSRMGVESKNYFERIGGFDVYGLTSSKEKVNDSIFFAQLLDYSSIDQAIANVNLDRYEEVYVIHSVGPFLFEDYPESLSYEDIEVNRDIYSENYDTFVNFYKAVKRHIKKQPVTWVAFGSVSDRYNIPFWKSYSVAKNDLRKFMDSIKGEKSNCVMINVSSTEKEEERPFADKSYWLSCVEVINNSMPYVLLSDVFWIELDIIKPSPNFVLGYYQDHKAIKKKWSKEMNG